MKAKLIPSGNWNVKVLDYIDERGKKHIRSFTAPTKEQAELLGSQFKSPHLHLTNGSTEPFFYTPC